MGNGKGLLEEVGPLELEALQLEASPRFDRSIGATSLSKAGLSVSIIVPAYNEERYLRGTLESLAEQTYGLREVIVVANGCTDRTGAVAKGRCDRLIRLRKKGLSRARNVGAQVAQGELLVFLDADTCLAPGALEAIVARFNQVYAAATIKGQPDSKRLPFRAFYCLKNFLHRSRLHEGSSGVIICWRPHFMAVGGFDEALHVCENGDLIRRLRRFGRYLYVPQALATTSMRRYDGGRFGRALVSWTRLWWRAMTGNLRNQNYEAVR